MSAIAAVDNGSSAVRATNKRRWKNKRVEVVEHKSTIDIKGLFQTNDIFPCVLAWLCVVLIVPLMPFIWALDRKQELSGIEITAGVEKDRRNLRCKSYK